jgi:hypothetical protein
MPAGKGASCVGWCPHPDDCAQAGGCILGEYERREYERRMEEREIAEREEAEYRAGFYPGSD